MKTKKIVQSDLIGYNFLLLGFTFYMLYRCVFPYYTSQLFRGIVGAVGVLLIIIGYVLCPRISLMRISSYARILVVILMVLGVMTFFRGLISPRFTSVLQIVLDELYFIPFLFPFLILIDYNRPLFFKILLKYGYFGLFVAWLFFFLNLNNFFLNPTSFYSEAMMEGHEVFYKEISRSVVISSFSYIISFFYVGKMLGFKLTVFSFVTLLLAVFSYAIIGRRGGVLLSIMVLILPLIRFKYIVYFLLVYAIFSYYGYEYLNIEYFEVLNSRGFENTRSWAEYEFYKDLDIGDWLMGRGALGQFYSSTYGWRGAIETGYLFFVLKAGVIFPVAYVFLIIISFFRSMLVIRDKVLSVFLFPYIISLFIFGIPQISWQYLLLWMCISLSNRRGIVTGSQLHFS